jgi:hypothetical protein
MAIDASSSSTKENKRELQRQVGRARESLAETVEEIKETAEQGYASVKKTVSGVLDYRDEFQKDPVVWSLGALSAGFALGYTMGYAHKSSKHGKHSQAIQFADRVVDELSSVGQSLLMPALSVKIKDFFGFDFAELLQDMRGKKTERKPPKRRQTPRLKSGTRKSSGSKKS